MFDSRAHEGVKCHVRVTQWGGIIRPALLEVTPGGDGGGDGHNVVDDDDDDDDGLLVRFEEALKEPAPESALAPR